MQVVKGIKLMETQNESSMGINFCGERERLKEAFLEAVHTLAELQDLQMNAVVFDDPRFLRFDDLIQQARRAKDCAKYALVAHMESHCYRKSCETEAIIYRKGSGHEAQSGLALAR